MDYINYWTVRAELPASRFLAWLGIGASKFHTWKERYGKVNEHNAQVPRDSWLEHWEKQAIVDFHDRHPLEGYRRLTFMMLDDDVVAVSPSSTYRVLRNAGRLDRQWLSPSKKGTGFVQPLAPHRHWHIDISYINVAGTFFYLCSLLDGYSRYIPGCVPGRARSSDAILVRRFPPVALVYGSRRRSAPMRVPGCLMLALALPWMSARAEDTALLKSNRSAASGAKTEERAAGLHAAARPSSLLRDWPECDKLSRHDAATVLAGGPSPLANADRTELRRHPWDQFQLVNWGALQSSPSRP